MFQHSAARRRLVISHWLIMPRCCFNTQPPEGGCSVIVNFDASQIVSTLSRPKAAGKDWKYQSKELRFQHSAARRRLNFTC